MSDNLPTVEQMIKAARRELKMRERAYPRLVEQESMSDSTAERELAAMRGILEILLALNAGDHETLRAVRRRNPQASLF